MHSHKQIIKYDNMFIYFIIGNQTEKYTQFLFAFNDPTTNLEITPPGLNETESQTFHHL